MALTGGSTITPPATAPQKQSSFKNPNSGGNYYAPQGSQLYAATAPTIPGFPKPSGQYTNQTQTSPSPVAPNNPLISQYNSFVQQQLANNQSQFANNAGIASQVNANNVRQAGQSADADRARLAEQRFRDVDLAGLGLNADQQHAAVTWDTLNRQYGLDMDSINNQFRTLDQQIGLDRQYNSDQQAGVRRDRALNDAQYQQQQQYLGWQKSNLTTLRDFIQRGFQNGSTAAQNQLSDLLASASLTKRQSDRANLSDNTARGALGSEGYGIIGREINDQYGNAATTANHQYQANIADLTLTRDRGNNSVDSQGNDINNALANAGFNYQGTNNALDDRASQLSYNAATGENQYQGNRNQLQNNYDTRQNQDTQNRADMNLSDQQRDIARQGIDSIAREYGIREGEVDNALQQAITKSGMDYNSTMANLQQQLASGNQATQQNAANFLAQLLANA